MVLEEFDYSNDADENIFRHGTVDIGGSFIAIDASTLAGSKDGVSRKPNEERLECG